MRDYGSARAAIAYAAGAVAVIAIYEAAGVGFVFNGVPQWVLAVGGFLTVARITSLLFDWLIRLSAVRRVFGGRTFVEGHWHLRGKAFGANANPLEQAGVISIQHDPVRNEARVVTSRLGADGELFTSASEIAFIDRGPSETRYLNYFKFAYPGPDTRFGMSSGVFANPDVAGGPPTVLETQTAVSGEGRMVRQQATRIDGRTRRKWRRQFGNFWIEEYLAHDGEFAEAAPPPAALTDSRLEALTNDDQEDDHAADVRRDDGASRETDKAARAPAQELASLRDPPNRDLSDLRRPDQRDRKRSQSQRA